MKTNTNTINKKEDITKATTEEVTEGMARDPKTVAIEKAMAERNAKVEQPKTDNKPKTDSKKKKVEKAAPVIDSKKVDEYMGKLSEKVTVKDLVALFNGVDGKYIRRHIRSHFIEGGIRKQTENGKATYEWAKTDAMVRKMVEYFVNLTTTPVKAS